MSTFKSIQVVIGDGVEWLVTVLDGDIAYDITNHKVVFSVRRYERAVDYVFQVIVTNHFDPIHGKTKVPFTSQQTGTLIRGINYFYDVKVIAPGEEPKYEVLEGFLNTT